MRSKLRMVRLASGVMFLVVAMFGVLTTSLKAADCANVEFDEPVNGWVEFTMCGVFWKPQYQDESQACEAMDNTCDQACQTHYSMVGGNRWECIAYDDDYGFWVGIYSCQCHN